MIGAQPLRLLRDGLAQRRTLGPLPPSPSAPASTPSSVSKRASRRAAIFGPTPRTPGMLSDGSPTRHLKSAYCAARTPKRARTYSSVHSTDRSPPVAVDAHGFIDELEKIAVKREDRDLRSAAAGKRIGGDEIVRLAAVRLQVLHAELVEHGIDVRQLGKGRFPLRQGGKVRPVGPCTPRRARRAGFDIPRRTPPAHGWAGARAPSAAARRQSRACRAPAARPAPGCAMAYRKTSETAGCCVHEQQMLHAAASLRRAYAA